MKTPPLSLCNDFIKEELELDENGLWLGFYLFSLDAADAAGLYSPGSKNDFQVKTNIEFGFKNEKAKTYLKESREQTGKP